MVKRIVGLAAHGLHHSKPVNNGLEDLEEPRGAELLAGGEGVAEDALLEGSVVEEGGVDSAGAKEEFEGFGDGGGGFGVVLVGMEPPQERSYWVWLDPVSRSEVGVERIGAHSFELLGVAGAAAIFCDAANLRQRGRTRFVSNHTRNDTSISVFPNSAIGHNRASHTVNTTRTSLYAHVHATSLQRELSIDRSFHEGSATLLTRRSRGR